MTSFCYICCYSISLFCWYNIHNRYNFITCNHWSISNTFEILTILKYMCSEDSTYNLFCTWKFLHSHWHVLLFHFWFELHVVLLNLHLQSHGICFVITLASFLFAIILNALTFMSFFCFVLFCFGTHIFEYKTVKLAAHLSKLIMNG